MPEQRGWDETFDREGNLIARSPHMIPDEQLEAEANQARLSEILQTFADCHASHMLPPPDLSSFILLICEYIVRSQPR